MFGARAAGGYPYNAGHRLCVLSSTGASLRKTSLQSAFGDFGHIVQIETPKAGLAFIAFADKNDAADAMREMDCCRTRARHIVRLRSLPVGSLYRSSQGFLGIPIQLNCDAKAPTHTHNLVRTTLRFSLLSAM
eukprot:6468317-Amphidinium_carterae.1